MVADAVTVTPLLTLNVASVILSALLSTVIKLPPVAIVIPPLALLIVKADGRDLAVLIVQVPAAIVPLSQIPSAPTLMVRV
jgi:hypothetical protein